MKKTTCCFMLLLLLFARECYAVDPYDNIALPQGLYLSLYPTYYTAEKLTDKNGDTAMTNLGSEIYLNTFRLTYYDKTILKNTLTFTACLPIGGKELNGGHDSGAGDATVAAGYWIIDDPASKTWFGFGALVDIPTGGYYKDRRANMGSNVWKFRPYVGLAKHLGKFDIELTLKYNIYTQNSETDTREGNEIISENYVGYFIRPNMLLGGLLNATYGNDRVVRGLRRDDTGLTRYQAGPSIWWKLTKTFSVTVDALFDFAAKNTAEGKMYIARLTWRL